MGSHLMRRPPKYVQGFIDRHGRPRFYFRRSGFKPVPLPGLPWSPEFMEVYQRAIEGQPAAIGADRTKPGTMRALAVSYFQSAAFLSMKPITRANYRSQIDRFSREHGDKRAADLQRQHVIRLMTARAGRPESANGLRKVLRAMMQHAVDIGLRRDDPTRDVKAIRIRTAGYHSWTESEIERFEQQHPIGSMPRLALALLLYTAQRKADAIKMGWQHIGDGCIHLRQEKTDKPLAIPIHESLQVILNVTPKTNMMILVTEAGRPFTPGGFGNMMRKWCNAAGLPQCTAHGLRKAAARRLAEAGASANEIAAVTGHASLRETARYTLAADQRRLAEAALAKIKPATSSVKLSTRFDKKRKNA
jgi:integrase